MDTGSHQTVRANTLYILFATTRRLVTQSHIGAQHFLGRWNCSCNPRRAFFERLREQAGIRTSVPSGILCKRALGHNGRRHLMVRTRGSLRHARPTDGTSSPLRQHPYQRQQQGPRRQVAPSKAQPRRRSKGSRRRATSPATQVAHKAFFRPRDRLPGDLPAHEARALPWFHDGPVLRSVDTPHLASLSNPIDIDVLRGCVAFCAMLAVAGRRW